MIKAFILWMARNRCCGGINFCQCTLECKCTCTFCNCGL